MHDNEEVIQSNIYTIVYKVPNNKSEDFELNHKNYLDKYCKYSSLTIYKSSYDLRNEYNGFVSVEDNENDYFYFQFNCVHRQKLRQSSITKLITTPKYYIYKYNTNHLIHPFLLEKQVFNVDFLSSNFAKEKIFKIGSYLNTEQPSINKNIDLEYHFYNLFNLSSLEELRNYFYENNLVFYSDVLLAKIEAVKKLNLDVTKQSSFNVKEKPLYMNELLKPLETSDNKLQISNVSTDFNKSSTFSNINNEDVIKVIENNNIENTAICKYIFSQYNLENDANIKHCVTNFFSNNTNATKDNDIMTFLVSYYNLKETPYRIRSPNNKLKRIYGFFCKELQNQYKKYINN